MNNKKRALLWIGTIAALWVMPVMESVHKDARGVSELSLFGQVLIWLGTGILMFPLLLWGWYKIKGLLS